MIEFEISGHQDDFYIDLDITYEQAQTFNSFQDKYVLEFLKFSDTENYVYMYEAPVIDDFLEPFTNQEAARQAMNALLGFLGITKEYEFKRIPL